MFNFIKNNQEDLRTMLIVFLMPQNPKIDPLMASVPWNGKFPMSNSIKNNPESPGTMLIQFVTPNYP